MDTGSPFGGRCLEDKNPIPEIRHHHVASERRGKLALKTPIQLGQGRSATQKLRKGVAAIGKNALQ